MLGAPIRKGLGYFLGGPHMPLSGVPAAFGHPVRGGSPSFAFGFTKNYITGGPERPSDTAYRIARVARAALGIAP